MSYYFGFLPSEELNNTINHAYALIHSHSSERYDVYRDKITHLTNKELMDSLLIKLIESLPDESERRTHLIKTAATLQFLSSRLAHPCVSPFQNSILAAVP